MHRWHVAIRRSFAVVALVAAPSVAFCQTTVTTTLPAAPSVPAIAAPAAGPRLGIVGALGVKCKNCRKKICNSPIGKFLQNMKGPLSMLTGGMVSPPGTHAALNDPNAGPPPPPPPAVSAAAKIKKEEMAAHARCDAVKYLATVDCHWYPEAEAALICALRTDRSECVRYEAAAALNNGCCCTKKTVEALRIAAAGSNRDGNPGERSMRVRLTAYHALNHCLCNGAGELLDAAPYGDRPETPENPLGNTQGNATTGQTDYVLPAYYAHLANRPAEEILQGAQRTVAALAPAELPMNSATPEAEPPSRRNVAEILLASQRATAEGSAPSADVEAQRTKAIPRPLPTVEPARVEIRRLPHDEPEPVYLSREPSASWR